MRRLAAASYDAPYQLHPVLSYSSVFPYRSGLPAP